MPLKPGAVLGPYEIVAPLGAGGMGEVYRARDSRLDRTVAIKTLPSGSQHADGLERFRREARLLSRLSHPHICAMHDIGESDGVTYLVMEYLEGETLAERLESGPLPLEQALRHAHQVATALDEAHRQGIVHRDLKPANIMLTRAGVKVLDFGLAKLREADDAGESHVATRSFDLTAEGVLLGTVPYMAPEQVEGRPADARTDIFAFGAVLHEMVTGSRPFKGDSRAGLIASILSAEPEPVSRVRPLAPPLLDRVVRRCLAKDPEQRWQTARDLAAELQFILESGSQAGLAAPAKRRRASRTLVLGGLLGAALAAGLLAAAFARMPNPPVLSFHQLTFRTGYLMSARFAPDGESVVYGAAWDGRPVQLFLGRVGSPEARPLGLAESRVLSISRAGEMALIRGSSDPFFGTLTQAPLAGGVPRELLQNVSDADWIADTSQLAVLRVEGGKAVLEFPLGNKVHEWASGVGFMRVSPRGDRVALLEWSSLGRGDVVVVDRAGTKTTLSRGWVGLFGLAWAPSGDEVWFSATRPSLEEGPPAVRAVSLAGKERLVTRAPTWLFLNEVFRDGRVLLASNFSRAGVRCQPPGETSEREMGWLDSSYVQGISPDGATLLFGEGAGTRGIVNGVFGQGVAGGAPNGAVYLRRTDGSPAVRLGEGYPFDLSPDGKWVLVARADGKEWTLLPTGPGVPKRLPLGDLTVTYVGQWLDSRRIAFGAVEPGRPMRAFVQDIETEKIRPVSPEGTFPATRALVLPGGRSVLAGPSMPWLDDPWRLYPVDGGDPRKLPFPAPAEPLTWSEDGRSLYVTDLGTYRTARNIYRQDVASGTRQLWRTLAPSDPAGLESIGPVVLTPDGRCYCYTYVRTLGTLYVVEGLK
jgi:hypothetical protein